MPKQLDEKPVDGTVEDALERRREALKKLTRAAIVTPPVVMGLLYSKRAMANSGE